MIIAQQFALRFASDEKEALPAFIEMLDQFTTKSGDKAKPDQVSLVMAELPMWRNHVTLFQDNFLRLKGICPIVDDIGSNLDESLMDTHEAATDLLDYTSKHWDGILDAHMAKRKGCLTGCNISQSLDGPRLLVKGANLIDIEKAIVKLDVLSSMMVSCLFIFICREMSVFRSRLFRRWQLIQSD